MLVIDLKLYSKTAKYNECYAEYKIGKQYKRKILKLRKA